MTSRRAERNRAVARPTNRPIKPPLGGGRILSGGGGGGRYGSSRYGSLGPPEPRGPSRLGTTLFGLLLLAALGGAVATLVITPPAPTEALEAPAQLKGLDDAF